MSHDRASEYKHADKTPEQNRGKRRETVIELRKYKRTDQHIKRRNIDPVDLREDGSTQGPPFAAGVRDVELLEQQSAQEAARERQLQQLVQTIRQEQSQVKLLTAVTELRRMLSQPTNPPIQQVIDAGLIPQMVVLMSCSPDPTMQLEAAWVVTNVCSGTTEQTYAVIHAGALPPLVNMLASPNTEPRDQAIWALANIAGDGPIARDAVLQHGALEVFLQLLQEVDSLLVIRTLVWAISNLCRYHNPPPPMEKVYLALPVIKHILETSQDIDIKRDACWAVSYVTTQHTERVQAVLQVGMLPVLVSLLRSDVPKILTPAIRALGNIVSSDSELMTQLVLDANMLPLFRQLLEVKDDTVRREICWTVSNIVTGSTQQRQQVIQSGVLQRLLLLTQEAVNVRVLVEIGYVIANMLHGDQATPEEQMFTLSLDTLPTIVLLLNYHKAVVDDRLRIALLNALGKVFQLSIELQMQYIDIFTHLEGHLVLDKLQQSHNPRVLQLVEHLYRTYLANEQADLLGMQPGVQPNQALFAFPQQGNMPNFNFG